MDKTIDVELHNIEQLSLRLAIPFSFSCDLKKMQDYINSLDLVPVSKVKGLDAYIDHNLLSESLWQDNFKSNKKTPKLSDDLYPHMSRILMGGDSGLTRLYSLNSETLSKLSTDINIALSSRSKAVKRLNIGGLDNKASVLIPFTFDRDGIQLRLFSIGIGLIEIHCCLDQTFLKEYGFTGAQEFVHALAHLNCKLKSSSEDSQKFTLRQLVESFLFKNTESEGGVSEDKTEPDSRGYDTSEVDYCPINLLSKKRVFSYSAIKFIDNLVSTDELSSYARVLAHRQTSDYKPSSNSDVSTEYVPFKNIAYAISDEGGAVVLNAEKDVQHLNNYINDKVKSVYWPMTLIAYLEYMFLLKLNTEIDPNMNLKGPSPELIKKLKAYRESLLQFRLQYRFSLASQLKLHNIYYNKWRQTFNSEHLMQELTEDITQINSFIDSTLTEIEIEREKKLARDLSTLGIIVSGILSLLSLWGTNLQMFQTMEAGDSVFWWSIIITLVLTFLAGFTYRCLTKSKVK